MLQIATRQGQPHFCYILFLLTLANQNPFYPIQVWIFNKLVQKIKLIVVRVAINYRLSSQGL